MASKGRMVKVECAQCGVGFDALAYKVKKGLGRYCSRKCSGIASRRSVSIRCENCDEIFVRRPSEVGRFCSVRCVVRGTAQQRARSTAAFYKQNPERKNEAARKISDTKKTRLRSDPDYAARLREQAQLLPKTTKESAAKRLATINSKYTKNERLLWARSGGLACGKKGVWNKGLTKETDERVAKQAKSLLGHLPNKGSGAGKGGYRQDIQMYVRSTWEADVVRVFNLLGVQFDYELKAFVLQGDEIDTYRPDFWLPQFGVWIEVSGWESPQKMRRLKMFKEQYPGENVFHIDKKVYSGLASLFRNRISNWEGKSRGQGSCVEFMRIVA